MGFWGDDRGVAPVVGAVLIFAFLIVALSSYQAFMVPNENVQIEFDHSERVEGQFLNVRNAILDVRSTQRDNFVTVELGTRYPARILAINPPHPTGTIETTEPRNITIRNTDGDLIHACPGVDDEDPWSGQSRMLAYSPNYNELTPPTAIRYENSVAYKQYDDRYVLLSGQRMIEGNTITIVPLEREFSASGRQVTSIEPMVGRLDTTEVVDPTLTFPTELDEESWKSLLDGQEQVFPENVSVSDGELTLDLTGTFRVRCGPVGVGETPESGTGDAAATDINPASPGDIRLESEALAPGTSSEVLLRFNNSADTNSITEARINFYNSREGGTHTPTRADISLATETETSGTLVFREEMSTLDPKIELDGGETTNVRLNFENDDHVDPNLNRQSFFVITIVLETGERGLYFVPIPAEEAEGNLDLITLDLDPETIEVGDESQATVRAIYDDGTWEDVTTLASYDVDNETVANETATGVFTGQNEGTTTITATYEEDGVTRTDTAELTVVEETVLDSIKLELDPTTIEPNGTSQATVTAHYTDGSTADVTAHANTNYSSSNETVATVVNNGTVTGHEEGTASITATYEEDGLTETDNEEITVSTEPSPAFFAVTIDSADDPVTEGDTVIVTYTIENTGDEEDTQDIIFRVDGEQEDTEPEVTLSGGNTFSGSFNYTTVEGDASSIEVEVASETETDSRTITVEEAETMADTTEYIVGSGDTGDANSDVVFDLQNTGGHSVEITGLTVDSTTQNNADHIGRTGDEFSGGGGSMNQQIDIGETIVYSLDTNATITSGTTEEFLLGEFRRDNGNTVNMVNEDVTLTLHFADGSSKTYTIDT